MDGFVNDFKNAFRRPNNALVQIILINVIIFLIINTVYIFSKILDNEIVYNYLTYILYIPSPLESFITRPWTIITYAFSHKGILHIFFNMLLLFWFGRLIAEYIGDKKLISIYVLGAIAGGLAYLLIYNTIPFYISRTPELGMLGASAGVYAVAVAAATLLPNYTFYLFFLGPVKIRYIAAFGILVSYISSVEDNAGGNIAHLGGALLGYIYIKQIQKGNDLGRPVMAVIDFVKSFFVKTPKVKVTYKADKASKNTGKTQSEQEIIDAILDKISASGYESLSKEEKQTLFKSSRK